SGALAGGLELAGRLRVGARALLRHGSARLCGGLWTGAPPRGAPSRGAPSPRVSHQRHAGAVRVRGAGRGGGGQLRLFPALWRGGRRRRVSPRALPGRGRPSAGSAAGAALQRALRARGGLPHLLLGHAPRGGASADARPGPSRARGGGGQQSAGPLPAALRASGALVDRGLHVPAPGPRPHGGLGHLLRGGARGGGRGGRVEAQPARDALRVGRGPRVLGAAPGARGRVEVPRERVGDAVPRRRRRLAGAARGRREPGLFAHPLPGRGLVGAGQLGLQRARGARRGARLRRRLRVALRGALRAGRPGTPRQPLDRRARRRQVRRVAPRAEQGRARRVLQRLHRRPRGHQGGEARLHERQGAGLLRLRVLRQAQPRPGRAQRAPAGALGALLAAGPVPGTNAPLLVPHPDGHQLPHRLPARARARLLRPPVLPQQEQGPAVRGAQHGRGALWTLCLFRTVRGQAFQ
ncbi:hypothetical protein H632_c2764p0, partial [Helicosporidium sp. ATCC 50920]